MSGSVEHMRFGKPRSAGREGCCGLQMVVIDAECKAMVDQGVDGADNTPTRPSCVQN